MCYGRSEVDEMYRVGGLSLVDFEPFDMTPTEPPRPGYPPSVGRIMAAGIKAVHPANPKPRRS